MRNTRRSNHAVATFSSLLVLSVAAGAVAVPLSWRWSAAELEHGLNHSRAKIVLADEEFADQVRALIDAGKAASVASQNGHWQECVGKAAYRERGLRPAAAWVIATLRQLACTHVSHGRAAGHKPAVRLLADEAIFA